MILNRTRTQAQVKVNEGGKLVTYTIRQNVYGNWYGYKSTRKVECFFGIPKFHYSQEEAAFDWLHSRQLMSLK